MTKVIDVNEMSRFLNLDISEVKIGEELSNKKETPPSSMDILAENAKRRGFEFSENIEFQGEFTQFEDFLNDATENLQHGTYRVSIYKVRSYLSKSLTAYYYKYLIPTIFEQIKNNYTVNSIIDSVRDRNFHDEIELIYYLEIKMTPLRIVDENDNIVPLPMKLESTDNERFKLSFIARVQDYFKRLEFMAYEDWKRSIKTKKGRARKNWY